MITLFSILAAVMVVIVANTADTTITMNAYLEDVPAGEQPAPPPPWPHSRGPPSQRWQVPDGQTPPPGGTAPIRPRPVPSAHDHIPAHPLNISPSGPTPPEIPPTNTPIM